MKEPYLMLKILIPGTHSPSNDIDAYLQQSIDELKKEVWYNGIEAYDGY